MPLATALAGGGPNVFLHFSRLIGNIDHFQSDEIILNSLTQFAIHLLTSSHFVDKLSLENVYVRIQLRHEIKTKNISEGHVTVTMQCILLLHAQPFFQTIL